jgi:signal peptidase I
MLLLRVKRIIPHLFLFFLCLNSLFLCFVFFGSGNGNRFYTVERLEGKSMEPTVHDGDLLIISHLGRENLKTGMIVAFETSEGESILHRIVTVKENGCLVTKGDNNLVEDGEEICQVNGILIMHIPKLGYFSHCLQRMVSWYKGP